MSNTITNAAALVTRNVVNTATGEKGAVIRVKGDTATVLLRSNGRLSAMHVNDLAPTRGRPIKLIQGLCRADVDALIESDASFRVAAIRELFGRQTDDEREVRATYYDNKVGFRADDAKRGSTLAVKSACAWTDEDHNAAMWCLFPYSGTQLWDLTSQFLSEPDAVDSADSLIAEIVGAL